MNDETKLTIAEQAFSDFESQEVSVLPFEQLAEGWHKVAVKMAILTTDFMKGLRNPVMKTLEELPVWKDATVQIAIYFEGENHRGATRRFSRFGYWKFDELLKVNTEKAAACTKEGDQGYAVTMDSQVRIKSDEATASAGQILNRLLTAAGVPKGTKGADLCKVLHGKELIVQVTKHIYNKEEYYDVQNFLPIDTPESEFSRVPSPKAKEVVMEVPATE